MAPFASGWSVSTAWSQFWLTRQVAEARLWESKLLDLALPAAGVRRVVAETGIFGSDDMVNSVSVECEEAVDGCEVVFVHGFCCGAGIFFRNLWPIASATGVKRVSAVDWRGAGLSSRYFYAPRTHDEACDYFVEGLEAWRSEHLEDGSKMVLVGHSMGGIIAARYAEAHPTRVGHLVLCGPAGVAFPSAEEAEQSEALRESSSVFRAAISMWDSGLTPGVFLRTLGTFAGGFLVKSYVQRRFSGVEPRLESTEVEALASYLAALIMLPGKSEQSMSQLLAPIAQARKPIAPIVESLKCPVTYIYGTTDWMRPQRGRDSADRMAASSSDCAFISIPEAGHYAFLDQPLKFNNLLLKRILCKEAGNDDPLLGAEVAWALTI